MFLVRLDHSEPNSKVSVQTQGWRVSPHRINTTRSLPPDLAPGPRLVQGLTLKSGLSSLYDDLRALTVFKLIERLIMEKAIGSKLKERDIAPDFKASTNTGEEVSLAGLKGKHVVLYFYPKDDTPGCTKEACAFRDHFADFKKKRVV